MTRAILILSLWLSWCALICACDSLDTVQNKDTGDQAPCRTIDSIVIHGPDQLVTIVDVCVINGTLTVADLDAEHAIPSLTLDWFARAGSIIIKRDLRLASISFPVLTDVSDVISIQNNETLT